MHTAKIRTHYLSECLKKKQESVMDRKKVSNFETEKYGVALSPGKSTNLFKFAIRENGLDMWLKWRILNKCSNKDE